MVKILSNGEIVQDDDPRASSASNSSARSSAPRQRREVHHQNYNAQEAAHAGGQVSVFDVMNQKLLDAGIPRLNVGPYVMEPIALVGFVLAFFLMGVNGLLFAGILFFVVKYSQGNAGQGAGGAGQGFQAFPGGGGAGGHRLGR